MQDRWTFAGSAGQRVRIEMSGFDTVLRLLDASESTVATNDDRASNDYGSLIEVTLPSTATYTIVAAGYGATSGTYRLSLSSAAPATPTPTSTPTPTAGASTPPPAALPPTSPPSAAPVGVTIRDGESANVTCGTGAPRIDATVTGIRPVLYGSIIGDIATITAVAPSGSTLRWSIGGAGSLTISGCTATYTATSIGTAYQTSATIRIMRATTATPTPAPAATATPCPPSLPRLQCGSTTVPGRADQTPTPMGGEGGPTMVVIDKTITINVYDPANEPQRACVVPGVALSINSVPTTDAVTWWVVTPRTRPFAGVFAGRNVTIVDGEGLYEIWLLVNGALRDQTQAFGACPIAVVRR